MSPVIAFPLAALLTVAAGWFGLTQALGAHPFWASKVTLIGAPAGLVIAGIFYGFGVPRRVGVVAMSIVTAAALAGAAKGKAAFAASYAEDQLAGQIWFYGWIIAAAGFSAALAILVAKPRS
jgi:hypothetical protein